MIILRELIERLVLDAPAAMARLVSHRRRVALELVAEHPPPVTSVLLVSFLSPKDFGLGPGFVGVDHRNCVAIALGEG
jgi:hypothetical protein